jgi:ATP-dependent helicase/nuclease subunit B
MQTFLSQLAHHLSEKHKDDLSKLCVILPNRRAKLFFKTQLSLIHGKPIWAPDIYSIEDWLTELSGLKACDNLNLTFRFYKVYTDLEGSNAQEFDEFVKWAQVLLHDFNEIDAYLVDTQKLFASISEAHAMEVWNVDGSAPTEFQKNYLKFWKQLGLYYARFKEFLLKENLAYQGLIFRHCSDDILNLLAKSEPGQGWKKLIFAGFNALSEAEEKIIRTLLMEEKAEIFWDADDYYLNNPSQEAGKFLRKYIGKEASEKNKTLNSQGKDISWIGNYFKNSPKNIHVIGVPQKTAQAKAAGEILSTMPEGANLQDTALVLADEKLLIPVINALPENIDKANITMGYPLKNAPFAGLADAALKIQENPVRMNFKGKNFKFYYKDVVLLLSHPYMGYLKNISIKHKELLIHIISRIRIENRIFLRPKDLEKLAEGFENEYQLIKPLFEDWEDNPEKALNCLLNLVNLLGSEIEKQNQQNNHLIESEYLYLYAKLIRQTIALQKEYQEIKNLHTLRLIFSQLVSAQALPFYGEPLSGLQIMGMLETRTLDFKTIILLSANEGTLPSGKSNNSFIPYEIKKRFGIPTYTEKDAIFAYHFYRLIQRAENIYLLYNTETDEMGSGEKSRFIAQMMHELPKINSAIHFTERLMAMPLPQNKSVLPSVKKSAEILEKIENLCKKGISPSALNNFNNCPLDFYFKYIAGLRADEEVEETIEAASMGTAIHDVLHKLYLPFIGKIIKVSDIDDMFKQIEEMTKEEFIKKFSNNDLSSGKNLLTLNISVNFIRNFLKKEKEYITSLSAENQFLTIQHLEETLEAELHIKTSGTEKVVKIKGTADRIDKIGKSIRLIDYKTGNVKPEDLKMQEMSQIADPEKGKSLQLLLYSLMYLTKYPQGNEPIQSGIIGFKKLSAGLMKLEMDGKSGILPSDIEELKIHLSALLSSLFDENIPFEHKADSKYCQFCV